MQKTAIVGFLKWSQQVKKVVLSDFSFPFLVLLLLVFECEVLSFFFPCIPYKLRV